MSKMFYGKWPEGYRTIKLDESLRPKKPITKPLVRALSNVGNGPLRDSLEEGDQ